MQADIGAITDRGHRLGLGEDLRIGADADFEILRPHALLDQRRLDLGGLVGTSLEVSQRVADDRDDALADLLGERRVARRFFLDDPLDHRAGESDAAGLDGLEIVGGEQ